MIIGIALCIWTLVMDQMSGIYLELVFVDGFLNFGQGLFVLALFGFDADYLTLPIRRWFRTLWYGQDSLYLPNWEELETETKAHCQQFLRHHVENCVRFLVKDIRYRLITYKYVLR